MKDYAGQDRRSHVPNRRTAGQRALPWALLLLPLMAGCNGCNDSATSTRVGDPQSMEAAGQWQEELLDYAVSNLNRLDESDTGEMLQEIVARLNRQAPSQAAPAQPKRDPLLETWPEPEMLRQIVNRLNQWIRSQEPPDWEGDPLLATLPEPLAELPMLKDLGQLEFTPFDGFALREAVWLRDVSNWARGEQFNDVERARRLFDWTVRNIQIEADTADRIPQVPWETLWFGRGTAMERAWVFLLLARQQGLDAALLALADSDDDPDDDSDDDSAPPRPWTVAILSRGELYLFDPTLGLPIPAPGGIQLDDDSGPLIIQGATLSEVVADEALLRQLDVEGSAPYPVTAAELKRVVALVEASPAYLSRRMKLLQSRLTKQQKIVLTAAPTAQAKRFGTSAHVAEVRLWRLPFETLQRRLQLDRLRIAQRLAAMLPFYGSAQAPLRKGRMLHLKGQFVGQQGAARYYQNARPSNRQLAAAEIHRVEKVAYLQAKRDATYWLGLIAMERRNYRSAIQYFARRTLEASPGGPWTDGANYNLARAYEASGKTQKAILQYYGDRTSPSAPGNLLRAQWLRSQRPGLETQPPPSEPSEPPAKVPEPEIVD